MQTCQNKQNSCSHPTKTWKLWSWNCKGLLFPGASCTGNCIFNGQFEVTIECLNGGIWKVPEEINLEDSCNNCIDNKWTTHEK